jgi:serine protease Do
LINIRGEVIGVNTAIISGPSGGGNVGIGFAIPINLVKTIYKDLREKGTVTRGWLGVMIQKITPELAKAFELKDSDGALVGDVIPDGPAAAAGIKRGDVIVKFNGQEVKDMEQLPKIVAQTQPETEVDVEVIRAGKMEKLQVRIAILKDPEQQVLAKADPLGMQVQDITPEIAQSLRLDTTDGVLVSDVTAGQPAAESGVKRGDVITEIDRSPVRNTGDYERLTANIRQGRSSLFLVRRGGSTIFIAVKVK